jgi:FkbM family methyltransferase
MLSKLYSRLSQEKRPFRFLVSRILLRTELCRHLKINRNGYNLVFHPTPLSANLWTYPEYLLDEEAFLRRFIKDGDLAIDIGANIGSISVAMASKVGTSGEIISIEADPKTFLRFTENIKTNAGLNVTALNCAVGESDGKIYFSQGYSDDQNHILVEPTNQSITINVSKLDDLLDETRKIRLIKIDVEGYEYFAFKGATLAIQRADFIVFEGFDKLVQRYNYMMRDIFEYLQSYDMHLFRIDQWKSITKINSDYASGKCEDFLAVSDEAMKDLELIIGTPIL